MGKERDIYRTYSTTDLKTRSSIPAAGDIAEHTGHIDCTNIKLSDVRSVLGVATYSLYEICRHDNINRWSAFSPIIRSISAQTLVNSVPSVCKLGDFAGYNHNALTPHIDSKNESIYVYSSTGFDMVADINIGEVRWYEELNVMGVAMVVYEGVTEIASDVVAIAGLKDTTSFTVSCPGIVTDKVYTVKFWFISSDTTWNSASILLKVPGCSDYNVTATVLVANYVSVSPDGFMTADDTLLEAGDCSFSSINGTFGFPTIHRHTGDPSYYIYARLVHQVDGEVDRIDIFGPNGDYVADTNITGDTLYFSSVGGMDPGPPYASYGYKFEMVFEASS